MRNGLAMPPNQPAPTPAVKSQDMTSYVCIRARSITNKQTSLQFR
jgi:hypothetical protein